MCQEELMAESVTDLIIFHLPSPSNWDWWNLIESAGSSCNYNRRLIIAVSCRSRGDCCE